MLKIPPRPSVAPATPQPLLCTLGWECLCSLGRAACAAGAWTQLQPQQASAQCWALPTELLGAQPQGSLGAGLRKGQVQVSKGRFCPSVSSGVLLPLHQRINNSPDFAATWQFAHDWEGLQSNSVMVKHPSFWAIA